MGSSLKKVAALMDQNRKSTIVAHSTIRVKSVLRGISLHVPHVRGIFLTNGASCKAVHESCIDLDLVASQEVFEEIPPHVALFKISGLHDGFLKLSCTAGTSTCSH